MEPVKEGFFAKLGAIGQVIGVVVAVGGIVIAWHVTHQPVEISLETRPQNSPPQRSESPLPQPATSPSSAPIEGTEGPGGKTRVRTESSRRERPALPLDFTLRDGEQRTFLGDQASVAAEFNQVGSEDFVTLRVGTTEGESVPHAVLGAGARFPVRVGGSNYSVYVLSVDKATRTIGVRISRNSESQEKKGQ